jgi:hypothetical protein
VWGTDAGDLVPAESPAVADQAGGAAGDVRAAAEAEEEQFVAGLVVLDDEVAGCLDVTRQAHAECLASQALSRPGSQSQLVVDPLLDFVLGLAVDPEDDPGDVGGTRLAVAFLVSRIPGAVAAQHRTFEHGRPL